MLYVIFCGRRGFWWQALPPNVLAFLSVSALASCDVSTLEPRVGGPSKVPSVYSCLPGSEHLNCVCRVPATRRVVRHAFQLDRCLDDSCRPAYDCAYEKNYSSVLKFVTRFLDASFWMVER